MTLVVADFGDNTAILGLDFMTDHDVILRLSLGKMMIGSETVVLHRENAKTLLSHYYPAYSCKIMQSCGGWGGHWEIC